MGWKLAIPIQDIAKQIFDQAGDPELKVTHKINYENNSFHNDQNIAGDHIVIQGNKGSDVVNTNTMEGIIDLSNIGLMSLDRQL